MRHLEADATLSTDDYYFISLCWPHPLSRRWFWRQLPKLLAQAAPTALYWVTKEKPPALCSSGRTFHNWELAHPIALPEHWVCEHFGDSAGPIFLLMFPAVGGLPHEHLSSCTSLFPNKNQELRVLYTPCHMAMTASAWKELACRTHKSVKLHSKTIGK